MTDNTEPPTVPLDPIAEEFTERLGVALEFFGLSRIAGRILAYLIYHQGPASFDDLTSSLRISRGSVSTNTRHLERLGVVQRLSRPGERLDYFEITPDSQARFLEAWFAHVLDIEDIISDTLASLPEDAEIPRRRIEYVDEFYRYVLERMGACITEWEERGRDRDARKKRRAVS